MAGGRGNGNDGGAGITTHICMPELSVISLLIVSRSLRNSNAVLHYDIFPRYIRAIVKICRVQPVAIEALLTRLAGIPMAQVRHGDDVHGYRQYHIKTQETTAEIAERLIPCLEDSAGIRGISAIIGHGPALAYVVKQIADRHIFSQLVALIACFLSTGGKGKYIAAWDVCWPDEWLDVVQDTVTDVHFKFFRWPEWYGRSVRFLFFFKVLGKLLSSAFQILRSGITSQKAGNKKYLIMTEFVDPRRLSNTCYDADYWVDGVYVHKEDLLLFLTRQQQVKLQELGYDAKTIMKEMDAKGYTFCVLKDLPYPGEIIREFYAWAAALIKYAAAGGNKLLAMIFLNMVLEYIQLCPLFTHYDAENCIYLTFPNGYTGLRYDTGIITGLCRKHGIRSIGCQTRAVHSKNYEYCFDCYDLYFAWGRVWYEMMGNRMRFIDKWVISGCIYSDHLAKVSDKYRTAAGTNGEGIRRKVCIFPNDISLRHHYSLGYGLRFAEDCARLAVNYPGIEFIFKSKEPEYSRIILEHEAFLNIYRKTDGNFRFEDRPRYGYLDILASCDIVIAMGFTTPGFEGLMLNKRTLYYNDLEYGGQAYEGLPDLVAGNYAELEALFKKALQDYKTYAGRAGKAMDELDPYRDGKALQRINKMLTGAIAQ